MIKITDENDMSSKRKVEEQSLEQGLSSGTQEPNVAAFHKILEHHEILLKGIKDKLNAIGSVVNEEQPHEAEVGQFIGYFKKEILPHAQAEEKTLYQAALSQSQLKSTIESMEAEHRELERLVEKLYQSTAPLTALKIAKDVTALFKEHVKKENELILPVLLKSKAPPLSALLVSLHDRYNLLRAGGDQALVDELDVRQIPPAMRHEAIFRMYHNLNPAASFIITVDHDPKPLYYQFSAEYAGKFNWEYIKSGPEIWQVRIGKPA